MLKQVVESVLVNSGLAAMARRRRAGSLLVLAYHNVVPRGVTGGEASLHLALDDFVDQLDMLQDTTEIVSLDRVDIPATGSRPRVAITFDDAYTGALELAIAEMSRRALPATIFVTPGLIGCADTWWDRYASFSAGAKDDFRDVALSTYRGESARVDAWMRSRDVAPTPVPAHAAIASESLLARVAALPGITLGCHTWDHPNLAALSTDEVKSQVSRATDWLSRFPASRPWIAYPYGLESPQVRTICRELGLTRGYRVSGGFETPGTDALGLPRYNVPSGLSRNGFRLRLGGILSSR